MPDPDGHQHATLAGILSPVTASRRPGSRAGGEPDRWRPPWQDCADEKGSIVDMARRWVIACAATALVGIGAVAAVHHSGVAAGQSGPIPTVSSPTASTAPATTAAPTDSPSTSQPNQSLRPSVKPIDGRTGKQLGTPFTVNGIQVVSNKHRVSGGFKPQVTGRYPLTPAAAKAFARLAAAVRKARLSIEVVSGYRSHAAQASLYRHSRAVNGRAFTARYVAVPGTSEHQTGLAVDLRSPSGRGTNFDDTREWRWLRAHAQDYGFVLRYPEGLTKVTGIGFEPWHWRFVGVAQAKAIRALGANVTIEQYLRLG